ncbi:Flippase-like domain-containing protein [Sulfidibacter corallicola]|uniref:Flippase-like domain-containing protein n=1 Tax=Sulfidibacter corallicola TaxID=2818388 RepID=A0A8A4THF5_SULCO|nr:lysylphosphatidylglycerol synthase transmembrane domain-containing protein [Sulfidibacter corallicola]QTD48241.1 flippase-like domain-containing protein [Sulfidibacter corallicola]
MIADLMMSNRLTKHWPTLVGMVLAGAFLFFAFRNVDLNGLLLQFQRIGWIETGITAALALTTLLLRGLRWWYLLPRPLKKGELWASVRAISLGYGVTNVASRLGEVVRILSLRHGTGRDFGSITATVVLDRLLLDMLVFAGLVGYSLLVFRDRILALFPAAETALFAMSAAILVGLVGLFWLGLAPTSFKRLLRWFRIDRLTWLWRRLEPLIDQISTGLAVLSNPLNYAVLAVINTATWGAAVVLLWYVMEVFGVSASLPEAVMMFTVSNLGMILPSPGGIGTYHYFTKLGLTQLLGVEPVTGAALVTFAHGVSYLATSGAAVGAYFVKPSVPEPES